MPSPELKLPEQGGFNAKNPATETKRRLIGRQESGQLTEIRSAAASAARKVDKSAVQKQAEKAAGLESVAQATNAIDQNLSEIAEEIKTAEKAKNFEKLGELYQEQSELKIERDIWSDRELQLKKTGLLENSARTRAEAEEVARPKTTEEKIKELEGRTPSSLPESAQILQKITELKRQQAEAEAAGDLTEQMKAETERLYQQPEDKPKNKLAGTPWVRQAQQTRVSDTQAAETQTEVDATYEWPKKSFWSSNPVARWGRRVLLGLGLLGAGRALEEPAANLNQSINEGYEQYQAGIESFAKNSPLVKNAQAAEETAASAIERNKKATNEISPDAEIGSISPEISQAAFVQVELPRMLEKAGHTLDVSGGLSSEYSGTDFLNDKELIIHVARDGRGNIPAGDITEALGRMGKYRQTETQKILEKETRDNEVAQKSFERIFRDVNL